MDKFPELKKKLFDEILPPVEKVRDNILDGLEFETVTEFEYLQRCFYEVLRFEPAVPLPTSQNMTRDCMLNGVLVKKDTTIFLNIWSIHHDPK